MLADSKLINISPNDIIGQYMKIEMWDNIVTYTAIIEEGTSSQ